MLTPTEQALYDIPLANKFYSPRVISHYKYYNEVVVSKYEAKLRKKCNGDIPGTWLLYNDVVYCNSDDVYALMTDEQKVPDEEILLPFDRIIGESGPILILYGNVKDPAFKQFISNLFESSKDGKFRFIWRYTPQNTDDRELLTGYGVDLTLKRTDYIVTDDRNTNTKDQQVLNGNTVQEPEESFNDSDSFLSKSIEDIEPVSKSDLEQLDLKLSSFVLSTDNHTVNFNHLKKVINGLPKFSSDLTLKPIDQELVEQIEFNTQIGLSPENSAMFINGAPLDDNNPNVFNLYKQIKNELRLVERIKSLGFGSFDARDLLSKFSLYSMFKNRGPERSRYSIESADSAVIYFNDIETDVQYSQLPNDLSVYLRRFQYGEIPPLRQNVHSSVFVINLRDESHLQILNKVFSAVYENSLPQRIGIIPLIQNDQDRLIANNIYHLVETKGVKAAFKYIQKLLDVSNVPKSLTEKDYASELVEPFLANFDIDKPYLIVNGVFHQLDSDWPYSITRQITEDVQLLTGLIYNKKVSDPEDLAEVLYAGSKKLRNSLIIPEDPLQLEYKEITAEFLKSLSELQNEFIEFKVDNKENPADHFTLTLGGSLGSRFTLEQLLEVLRFAEETDTNVKVRIINQSDGAVFIGRIKQALNSSVGSAIQLIEKLLEEHQFAPFEQNQAVEELLKSIDIDSKDFLLLNGRFIMLEKVLDVKAINFFVNHELDSRLSLVEGLLLKRKFVPNIYNFHDWFEVLSSIVSKSYYVDPTLTNGGTASRFDFNNAKTEKSIKFGDKLASDVHVLLTVDPAEEVTQKLVSLVDAIKDLPFVSIEILLQPQISLDELKVKRFYESNIKSNVEFNEDGSLIETQYVTFDRVPEKTLFTLDLDVHSRWIVVPKEGSTDLDNVILEQSGSVTGIYELEHLVIEGNVFTAETLKAPTGLSVQIPGSDTNVMTIFGYIQLKANPGLWDFSIKEGRSSDIYSLSGIGSSLVKTIETDNVEGSFSLPLFDLDGVNIYSKVVKKPGKENETLIIQDSEEVKEVEVEDKKSGIFSRFLSKKVTKKQADINIFSIASGHLYERLLSIMTASVMANTEHTVKFWLIDNYMSPSFRKLLPHLAEKYGFEYELITYKWPSWLIGQREKQRTIWGYKILFLDVLFPQDLDKVIFVDADQIVRTDMKELVDLDLEGAPYGYTPMGDSREEMEGFRFWKQGYWKDYLGDKFKYHISALYVIDLKKFRQIAAGDRLRQHYAMLSKDPNSLSNLDQDLPNNLQHHLKIFSLPQEWLWCETWCDDESLSTAKTIDLCNNPLTKEHKLDRARRQIPEWSVYDQEINKLHNEVFKIEELNSAKEDESFHDEL